jgi:glycerol 3-phosphatase-2
MLRASREPLTEIHDLAVLDLDGVVYIGPHAVDGAVEALRTARDAGMRLAYVTNNASRTPQAVADQLVGLGFEVSPDDVVTSAQAAARVLGERVGQGARVFVLGGEGLERAVTDAGFEVVTDTVDDIAAVAQGYGPEVPWRRVIEGAILVRSGLPWVVSNTDMTIPTAGGIGPGNGTLVDLVARFAERSPVVAGKPEAPLFEETRDRMAAASPVVVGDRLDTDIAGAVRLGWASLLVLTGVTGLDELVAAAEDERPTYLSPDLGGLHETHTAPEKGADGWSCDGWEAGVDDGALWIRGEGPLPAWWRVLACAAWDHLDASGSVASTTGLTPPERAE